MAEIGDTKLGYGCEMHGPFVPEYRLTSEGYVIPYIVAYPQKDGLVNLSLDGRFGAGPFPAEDVGRWLYFIANAMAVSAGYSCHGENSTPVNPFKVKVKSVSPSRPDLMVIDGGKDANV